MCELTLIRVNEYENLLYQVLLKENFILNNDGSGIFTKRGKKFFIRKDEFLIDISKIPQNEQILFAHTRKASYKNRSLKNLDEIKSHPFDGKNFVLAHNGTLNIKNKEKFNIITDKMIDSEQFLAVLDFYFEELNDFVESIKKASEEFTGTFAFIIFNKIDQKIYIVRGTRTLYFIKLNNGIVINTELDDVETSIEFINSIFKLLGIKFRFRIVKYELIESNSIFIYNEDSLSLEKIGSVEEKKEELNKINTYSYYNVTNTDYGSYKYDWNLEQKNKKNKIEELAEFLKFFNVNELDNIVNGEILSVNYNQIEKLYKDLYGIDF